MNKVTFHPTGEARSTALTAVPGPVAVDTFGVRVHVEWDSEAAVTPLGLSPFFMAMSALGVAMSYPYDSYWQRGG